jgi:predicted transcriptional regulator
MDAYLSQVGKVVDDLVSSTFQFVAASRSADVDEIQRCADRRASVVKQLVKSLKKYSDRSPHFSEIWEGQFAQIRSMEDEIATLLRWQSSRAEKELRSLLGEKLEFLNQNQINLRGSKLETQG